MRLAEVPRATVYRRLTATVPQDASAQDLLLCQLIDEEYTSRPFYGSRRMVVFLRELATSSTRQPQARAAPDAQFEGLRQHG